jgi:Protein of unknown function (DUF1553)/Protein of unknown function (DUF1549)
MSRITAFALFVLLSRICQAEFTVVPSAISLTGPSSSAKVLVQNVVSSDTQKASNRISEQLLKGFDLRIANPAIARIEGSEIVAVADGATELIVRVEGQDRVARIPVTVNGASEQPRWQFADHVQSILSRQGCNSGACHGALAGKGGFRLSLLGYDANSDIFNIASQDQSRRIEIADPAASLFLAKPSMEVAHKGGLRLEKDSQTYKILQQWIADGAAGPSAKDAGLAGIEVLPGDFQVRVGAKQNLIVRARYQDGRIEDVTHWAKFSSTRASIAEVDANGVVTIMGQGRGSIVAWFSSRIAIASIDVPYSPSANVESSTAERERALANFQPKNQIDHILLEEWKSLGLAPSPTCDDATFLRRAYLDVTGTLPTPELVLSFLNDKDPAKRERLIDQLLNSKEYVDYWTYLWSDLLLVNGNILRPAAVEAFYKWIRAQVENNTPWNEFARQIVLAKGDSVENGATNFYAIHQTPESMTENTCLAFMGLSIECAKCHNHPLERWTNDQYYAMANMFSRVRAKGWGGDARNGDGKRTVVVLERGELVQPSRGKPQLPAPLDEPPLNPDSTTDRREALAEWLTHPRNSYFSRSIVNRVWANFLGTGLVESVDDLRVSNPPISERLMQSLTQYVIANQYDLKSLMRLIMNSQVYQLSSEPRDFNQADQRLYCRYYPRRLMAEVLHDAVMSVTEVPTAFDKIEFSGADKQPTTFYPLGTKSLALYDSAVSNYFLQTFGRNQRRITCDCERSDQPTVVQALHLNNGVTINEKLSNAGCVITKWIEAGTPDTEIIEIAYVRTLSRTPSEQERAAVLKELTEAANQGAPRREVLEDLMWTLMSSTEFLFTH